MLALGAAFIHLSAADQDSELPAVMAAFLALATLQAGLGALLLWGRPARALAAFGAGLMAGAFAAWLTCRIAPVNLPEDAAMGAIGFKDGVAVLFELASLPGLMLLASRGAAEVKLPSPRLGARTLALTAVAAFVLVVPALVLEGGGHHPAALHPGEEHHDRVTPPQHAPPGRADRLSRHR